MWILKINFGTKKLWRTLPRVNYGSNTCFGDKQAPRSLVYVWQTGATRVQMYVKRLWLGE